MKKLKNIIVSFLFLALFVPNFCLAETPLEKPAEVKISRDGAKAVLSWKNPSNLEFSQTILFRSTIPIEEYFTYEAVDGICDKLYEGQNTQFQDNGLAVNLPYYYILFAQYKNASTSKAVVLQASQNNTGKINSLAGATSETVNQISFNEAGIVFNYNQSLETEMDEASRRLSLFIIVKSPHDLNAQDKNAISYFIHAGTPTTILLGSGERAGVLNSYLSVFEKLPTNVLEWQDVIKIANGRWPDERNTFSEKQAADVHFSAIYARKPDMDNANDNAAVTVIAYGLRPAARNLDSEKNAINIFESIFSRNPGNATDWDLVRAIAYSGAVR